MNIFRSPLKENISSICCHNDLVITAAGKNLQLWKRGKQVSDFVGHDTDIHLLLPFAEHLLSVDKMNCLRIWEIKTTELYLEIQLDSSDFEVTSIMHPSTYLNKILLGSKQGTMQLWNIKNSRMIHLFSGWCHAITVIEQAPAIHVVAVGLCNGNIFLHNLKFDKTLMSFMQDWGAVTSISFRTDHEAIMATGSTLGHIALWNLERKCLLSSIRSCHDRSITSCRFLPSQPLMITTSPDNSLKIWIFDEVDGSGRLLKYRSAHSAPVSKIRFHGYRGHSILSAGQDCSFRLTSTIRDSQSCELSQGSFLKRSKNLSVKIEELKLPVIVDFASEEIRQRDWDGIISCHYGTSKVWTWNYVNKCIGKHILQPKHEAKKTVAKCVAISCCGNYCVIGYLSGHVDIFNIQSGIHRGFLGSEKAHDGAVLGVLINDLNQLIITASSDRTVKFWYFNTKSLQATLKLDVGVSQIILHRESSLIALALDDFTVKIVDVEIKRVVRQLNGHRNRITDMAFSPDSRWLITSALDSTIRTWDLPSGRLIDSFLVQSPATSLTFSPVGEFLATSHVDDWGIYLWANKTLYDNVSYVPLPADYEPLYVDMPLARSDVYEEMGNHEANDNVTLTDVEKPSNITYQSPDQISSNLITLSLLPESRWKTLLNLDIINKRNKPIEPPQAPKSAPFFLPTIPGVELKFDVKIDCSTKSSSKSKMRKITNFTEYSEFQQLLIRCSETKDYELFSVKLKELGPSSVDAEFRCLGPESGGDFALMKNILDFFIVQLKQRKDFELVQGYIALFLKLHSDVIYSDTGLVDRLKTLEEEQVKCWSVVQDLLNQNLCLVNYLKNATL
ncbi:WD repeat-containing protein 36-like isoform X2 [Xenia sp. Carnegie-2017]|uniref:WD repeat-containing protein 36-like isoform X2 n=1 Tax=Xenia sp. Carnegie-2017 TaxID=2897299 RepID=UPI001F03EE01|nr:WD repeat-containing protein 36-like isoform X2 [Xenia sp. Carnegie-2017]